MEAHSILHRAEAIEYGDGPDNKNDGLYWMPSGCHLGGQVRMRACAAIFGSHVT